MIWKKQPVNEQNQPQRENCQCEQLRQALQRLLLASSRYRSRPVLLFSSRVVNASAQRFTELSDAMQAAQEVLAATDSNPPRIDGVAGDLHPRLNRVEEALKGSSLPPEVGGVD